MKGVAADSVVPRFSRTTEPGCAYFGGAGGASVP